MKTLMTNLACILILAGFMQAQTNELLFQQTYYDGGGAFTSAFDPDHPLDLEVAENFNLPGNGINAVEEFVFYGITLKHFDPGGWIEQTPGTTEPFFIRFYGYSESTAAGLFAAQTGNHAIGLKSATEYGWWGGGSNYHRVTVLVNGVVVLNNITLLSGTGPVFHDFHANAGDNISTIFTINGQYAADCYYAIFCPYVGIIAEEGGTFLNPGASVPTGIDPAGQLSVNEPDWTNPVWSQYITADVENVGQVFGGNFQLYKFTATLDNPVYFLDNGWVSAQIDAANGSGTWFLWLNSLDGDGQSWQRTTPVNRQAKREMPDLSSVRMKGDAGSNKAQLGFDLAMELWGDPDPAFDYCTIPELYTTPGIQDGDTVRVPGYYTHPDDDRLLYFYGDILRDEPLPPQSSLRLEGLVPPANTWDGGYLFVRGTVTFEPNEFPYYPEDSVTAVIDVFEITVVFESEIINSKDQRDGLNMIPGYDDIDGEYNFRTQACDSCKFAILISGDRTSKYWRNLSALYNHKVNNENYCPHNVFVHFHNGNRPIGDTTVPQNRVSSATMNNIRNSHIEISRRVAECNRKGEKATFQKLVTGHGDSLGNIVLWNSFLRPDTLRSWQQPIIDSCARTIKDEFLHCYAGHAVDAALRMKHGYKATIYANSNSNNNPGISRRNRVHFYLEAKIAALAAGRSYDSAIVSAKLAYDEYLLDVIARANNEIPLWQAQVPGQPHSQQHITNEINAWTNLRTHAQNGICKSRNTSIKPMTRYCDWVEYVIPPGGQLILDFDSDNRTCANVSVYRIDPVTGDTVKVKVWNWNNPRSHRYQDGNNRRVINGDSLQVLKILVHSDANTRFVITGEVTGNQALDQSPSNVALYPGFSFGGRDGSANEFRNIYEQFYYIEDIDQIPISLTQLPARMGGEYVSFFGCSFSINVEDEYWTEMELVIDVAEVFSPGIINIFSENSPVGFAEILIDEPGRYYVPFGDMTFFGSSFGSLGMEIPFTETSGLDFTFDSWGLRTLFEQPLHTVTFIVLDDDDGTVLPGVLISIVGEDGLTTDSNGMASIQLPDGFYTATASKDGYESIGFDFIVSGEDLTVEILLVQVPGPMALSGELDGCFDSEEGVVITDATVEAGAVADIRSGSTINAAGFELQQGGTALMTAVQSILLGPNVTIAPGDGGLFHASIGVFEPCGLPFVAADVTTLSDDMPLSSEPDALFKVFPNPTTGQFTLVLKEVDETTAIAVEIFNMMGEKVISHQLFGQRQYEFDLSGKPRGLYILRVMHGDRIGIERVIKQ